MDMNRKSDNRTGMHRNFSMSGSGTRGSEMGRGRIGAEEDDIRTEHTTGEEAGDDTRTINDWRRKRWKTVSRYSIPAPGSARRGNRAGMEDNDEGTIIEG